MANIGDIIAIHEALGGSGGGGGGGALVFPTFTRTGQDTCTCDMTFSQIKSAVENGSCIMGKLDDHGEGFATYILAYYSEAAVIFAYFEPQYESYSKGYSIICTEDGFGFQTVN